MLTEPRVQSLRRHAFRKLKRRFARWDLLLFLALAGAVVATLYPVSTTFDVAAVTDRLNCTTSKVSVPVKWSFQQTDVEIGWDDSKEHLDSGIFQPAPNTDIHFQRLGHGAFEIEAHAHETNESVGTLSTGSKERVLPDRAMFRLRPPADQNAIYPLSCRISVGDVLKASSSPGSGILRSGTVTPIGHSTFSKSRYEADSTSLEPGDEFAVIPEGNSEAYGFILIDDRPSMNTIYRANGKTGSINRFGGTGFEVDISLLSRIKHDGILQGFWAAFVFITGLRISRKKEARK